MNWLYNNHLFAFKKRGLNKFCFAVMLLTFFVLAFVCISYLSLVN